MSRIKTKPNTIPEEFSCPFCLDHYDDEFVWDERMNAHICVGCDRDIECILASFPPEARKESLSATDQATFALLEATTGKTWDQLRLDEWKSWMAELEEIVRSRNPGPEILMLMIVLLLKRSAWTPTGRRSESSRGGLPPWKRNKKAPARGADIPNFEARNTWQVHRGKPPEKYADDLLQRKRRKGSWSSN